ncbi:small-conductance mechanosensitive channel [Lysobacter niastensis]|uniref:Small-conductance mechanosensitive channel n=1 Tax=Lysobacter niastensis TaxID=380629 RepID=A0ABU1W794_9GAMM|nr:mechanosensitive ion channel domain-containing protein [Lysobacter niastensis]MDR7133337.1 small-conductance mechanosensitive channel [Lysobacter niastensis]
MHRPLGLLACVLCLAVLLGVPSAQAQKAPALLDEKERGPGAIAMAEIPVRADDDERFAEEVIERSRIVASSRNLLPRLEAIERSVDEKAKLSRSADLKTLPVMRLESLERHWKFDARQFDRWQQDMRQAGAPYSQDAAELARRRADWEATKKAAATGGMATALSDRIDAVTRQLDLAERALSPPLEKLIQLGRRANALESRIEGGQKAVAIAIDYIDSRLVRLDAPVLWDLKDQPGPPEGALDSVRTGLEIETRFLKEYSAANLGNQRALNVLQLLLLPLLLWLSFRSRRTVPVVAQSEASARVLRRPLSSWLLLSMMGVMVFEPDAPLLLQQFAMLVALVPVLRLLPPHGFRLLGPWPYVATILYVLERLGFLFLANNVLYRSYYLGLAVVSLFLVLWLLWRARHMDYSGLAGRFGKAVHVVAMVSVVLLAVSAVSNIVGNVSLAEMLLSGVIDSGYMGLVLYAGVTVISALLQLLVSQRSVARFRLTRTHAAPILQGVYRLLAFGAVIAWVVFTMTRFRVFRPAYAVAESALTHEFGFGEISITLGHVLVFFISLYIAALAARTVRVLLQDELLPKMALPRGVGNSIASLSYYALLLLGLLVALSAAGFKVSQLTIVFGALGVGIGFGLQNVVNNFVSGLILMFERPIQPGDVIDITGTSGRVREIGMRATTIKTFDGADVIVPNGTLLSEKVTNWTLLDMNRRLDVDFGVAYGSDPDRVVELLTHVASETPQVAKEPAPAVLFTGLGASSLNFSIRAWTHDYDNWVKVRSTLLTRVHAALVEAGIEIPYPQQDLHLRSVSKQARSMLAPPAEGSAED